MNLDEKIKQVMTSVLRIKDSEVPTVRYSQHFSWDSLNHVMLISKLEESISVKFRPEEIIRMTSFEEILKCSRIALERR